jgi:hypothetical protein
MLLPGLNVATNKLPNRHQKELRSANEQTRNVCLPQEFWAICLTPEERSA